MGKFRKGDKVRFSGSVPRPGIPEAKGQPTSVVMAPASEVTSGEGTIVSEPAEPAGDNPIYSVLTAVGIITRAESELQYAGPTTTTPQVGDFVRLVGGKFHRNLAGRILLVNRIFDEGRCVGSAFYRDGEVFYTSGENAEFAIIPKEEVLRWHDALLNISKYDFAYGPHKNLADAVHWIQALAASALDGETPHPGPHPTPYIHKPQ